MLWILGSKVLDSRFSGTCIPDSVVSGIPDSLNCFPGSKAQDSGIHKQEFLRFQAPYFLIWGEFSQAIRRASDTNIMVTGKNVACENIRSSSLFAAGHFSRGGTSFSLRNVPSGEELGETDYFAG